MALPELLNYRVKEIILWSGDEFFLKKPNVDLVQNFYIEHTPTDGIAKAIISFSVVDSKNQEVMTLGVTMEGYFQYDQFTKKTAKSAYMKLHALCQSKTEKICAMAKIPCPSFRYAENVYFEGEQQILSLFQLQFSLQ